MTDALTILLVEDNAGDAYMIREAMEEAGIVHKLHVVDTGDKAMDFLLGRGKSAECPECDLMILDLNLPAKPGKEIMAEMQASQRLRSVPVAVFTTSRSEAAVGQGYPMLRSTFAVKTPSFKELVQIVKGFAAFARRQGAQ